MPTEVVKTDEDEQKWEKAKQKAEEAGHEDDYAYIMSIYKNMCPDYEFEDEPDHCSRVASLTTDDMRRLKDDLLRLGSVDPSLRPKIYPLLEYIDDNIR